MSKLSQDKMLEVLTKARELISIGYVRGHWALDHDKKDVDPWNEDACCFCIEGAIIGACHFDDNSKELEKAAITLVQAANKEFVGDPVLAFKIHYNRGDITKIDKSSVVPLVNDSHSTTQQDVVRFFNNAIELVKRSRWK